MQQLPNNIKKKNVNPVDKLKGQPELLFQFLYHLPNYALLLDKNRLIICSNDRFLADNDLLDVKELFGKGPGDIFQCENAEEAGCGNSPNCQFCGIYKTIAECAIKNAIVSNTCKLMVNRDSFVKAFEFMVKCSPINIEEDKYFLLTLTDISAENRKLNLERIFFHDVLNMVSGFKGLALIMDETNKQVEMNEPISVLLNIANKLCENISAQRDLINAEKRELVTNFRQIPPGEIITSVIENSIFDGSSSSRHIHVSGDNQNFLINTDPVLLSRVLINMVKNALEAPNLKQDITIGCSTANGRAIFFVHNYAFIEEKSAKCIFQPMFSTKGNDRGLGTYSMRLIGENYLKGKVWFKTHPDTGTTFTIELPINTKSK